MSAATSVSAKMVDIYDSPEGPRYLLPGSESHGKAVIHHPHMSPDRFIEQRHTLTTEQISQLELLGLCIQSFQTRKPPSLKEAVCKDTTSQGVVQRFLDWRMTQTDAPSGGPILGQPTVGKGEPIPSSSSASSTPNGRPIADERYDGF